MPLIYVARYLFFVWMSLFLSACATMRYFPIETLQPAQLTFEGTKRNIAICASPTLLSDAMKINVGAVGLPADSLIANILFSLQRAWKEAPGYENAVFLVGITPDDELPDTSKFDLIVRLNRLQITNTYYGYDYSYFEWEAYLHVQYAATWSIRNKLGALIDEYTDRDLIEWLSGIRAGKSEAVMNLPDIKDAWWDAGIALAQNYAARIVPQWRTEMRDIYMVSKFPELSRQAYTAMQNDSYARAFDIWENMLLACRKHWQKKTKSQIVYNMAVACEFQNQLEDAIHWAQRSANLKKKYRAVQYLDFLRERQQQQTQLDQQTTP